MLTIIFSTSNEEKLGFLEKSLDNISSIPEIEIIIVDYQSKDNTLNLAKEHNAIIIHSDSNSRGFRLDQGTKASTNDLIIYNHPRSVLDPQAINFLIANKKSLNWGGFTHCFDKSSGLLNFTSWYSNYVRGRIREIFYLDHCIYVKKSLMNSIGGFPHDEIFEDTIVCEKLRNIAPAKLLPFISQTSAIRFQKNGQWRQALLNQVLKIAFLLNTSPEKMNKIYELGLNLNSKY